MTGEGNIKILLIVNNLGLSKKIEHLVRTLFTNARCDLVVKLEDAKMKIDLIGDYKIILYCGYNTKDEKKISDFFSSLIYETINIAIYNKDIDAKCSIENLKLISSARIFSDLTEELKKILKSSNYKIYDSGKIKDDDKYLSIPTKIIKRLSNVPCDLYIKLSSSKLVKIFSKGSLISIHDIEKLEFKKIEDFFLRSDDFFRNCDQIYGDKFDSKMFQIRPKAESERLMTIFHDSAIELGISDEMIRKVSKLNDEILKTHSDKKLKHLFDDFKNRQGSFLYNHSYLMSLLSCSFVQNMPWSTTDIQKKLCLASSLHDMGFSNEKYALHEEVSDDMVNKMSKNEKYEVLNHSRIITEKLNDIPDFPSDVIKIIRNHVYGVKHKGVPYNIGDGQLDLPSCVFILTHDLVINLYRICFIKSKILPILDALLDKYDYGPFKKLTKDFHEVMKKILC